MTEQEKIGRNFSGIPGLFAFVSCLGGLFLILLYSGQASNAVLRGAKLALTRVLPALFPCMVIAGILNRLRIGKIPLPRKLGRALSRGLSAVGITARGLRVCLLGILCGAPLAAKCISEERTAKRMPLSEAQTVLFCASNPSPAFLIGAVGVGMFSSRAYGVLLFVCSLFSSVLLALLFRRFIIDSYSFSCFEEIDSPEVDNNRVVFMDALMDSLLSAGKSCFLILLNLSFFSLAASGLGSLLSRLPISAFWEAFLTSLPEMTGGFLSAAALPECREAAFLSGFCAGFGGLSVIFQVLSIAGNAGIGKGKFLCFKLLQGCLAGVFLLILT